MSFTRLAAAAFAASVLWGVAASAGGPQRAFQRGLWSGGAYTDDRTGAFTHCSAGVHYDSGTHLFLLITTQYRWWLGFINPTWSFTPDVKSPIRLRFDGGARFDRLATAPNGQLLLVLLPDSSRLVDAFRHSAELVLDAQGQSFSFKLNDTSAVIDRLTNCVQTSVVLADEAPSGEPSSAVMPGSERDATRADQASAAAAPAGSGSASASRSAPAMTASAPGASSVPLQASPPPPASPGAPTASPAAAEHPATANGTASAAAAERPASANATASAASPLSQTALIATAQPLPPPRQSGEGSQSAAKDAPSAAGTEDATGTSSAALPARSPAPETPDATVQSPPPGAPHLAFTAVTPVGPPPPGSVLPLQPATSTGIEEVRLATDFLTKARLQDAHLVIADKPPALAEFTAVWRSGDAAGAVKIVPPGPDISASGIASNLIAVDPRICKGDFTAARFRTNVANSAVVSAILSCTDANHQRVTEYLITPRHQGGFVVFAVIRSGGPDTVPDFDRTRLEGLSRAAIEAVAGQG